MKHETKLSVRALVEFLLKGGSIDSGDGGSFDPERAAEGSRIHRKLQSMGGGNYDSEIFLSRTDEIEGISYTLEGRADGVFLNGKSITIDEIKTLLLPLEDVGEDFCRAHWGQAMCYGFIYCSRFELAGIDIRLTYVHAETLEQKHFIRSFTVEELSDFYFGLLRSYSKWAKLQQSWEEKRNASIETLQFPFPAYRKGQHELAAAVYRTIVKEGRLFCSAPTGIGKTISVLFPAMKAMGEGRCEKLFYLTAKTVVAEAARGALAKMCESGLSLHGITLTAKDKICFLEKRDCTPEACPYANGYYDRVNEVIYDMLQTEEPYSREMIEVWAKKHMLCPFELSLDLSLWCDVIICDYNYVFDPLVYLRRYFAENRPECVFLVDEAHNLPSRAREMYSASLKKTDFSELKKALPSHDKKLLRALTRINTQFVAARKLLEETDACVKTELPSELCMELDKFITVCGEWRKENQTSPLADSILEVYFAALAFLKISEFFDRRYVTHYEKSGRDIKIKLFCVDPSQVLAQVLNRAKASILFSATLSPLSYFSAVCGGGDEAKRYALASPYRQEHLGLYAVSYISTRYKDRAASLVSLTEAIHTMVSGRTGNYIAYFPSYQYLNDVYQCFTQAYPEVETISQTRDFTEEERADFLNRFSAENEETLLGFCVLGGVFSEGVDLAGERLIGCAIIGVGLSQLNFEQDVIRDFYQEENGQGFDYAYRYPGMNKVLQAAGRVIRSEDDRGIVLLLDDRFLTRSYLPLLPQHWNHYRRVSSQRQLENEISQFWSKF
jgi:DNA excision repair protein ERCC-2